MVRVLQGRPHPTNTPCCGVCRALSPPRPTARPSFCRPLCLLGARVQENSRRTSMAILSHGRGNNVTGRSPLRGVYRRECKSPRGSTTQPTSGRAGQIKRPLCGRILPRLGQFRSGLFVQLRTAGFRLGTSLSEFSVLRYASYKLALPTSIP